MIVITPEVMAAVRILDATVRAHLAQSEVSGAAIDAIREQQYWAGVEAGAVGASLPLVDDCDDEGEWVSYL